VSGTDLFAGTDGYVWLSTNNGTNWTPAKAGLTNAYVSALAVMGTNVFAGTNHGIYRSTDHGMTWDSANVGLKDLYVRALAFSGTTLFAGMNPGGVYRSTNNGLSWDSVNAGLSDHRVNTLAVNGTWLFAGTGGGGVYRSADNGLSWDSVNTGLTDRNLYTLAVAGTNLFAGTTIGGIFRSTNNGLSWDPVNEGLQSYSVESFAVNGSDIYAGTGRGVYRSIDGGTSWIDLTAGFPNMSVLSLAVIGSDLFAGTGGGGVYLSTDNGVSWNAANSGMRSAYVCTFALSGASLFAGTNGGLFLSTDDGTNWKSLTGGPGNLPVLALAVSGTDLFAGTSSGGVYLSTDNGTTWTPVNSGFSGPGSQYISALAAVGTNLYAGTYGEAFVSTDNGMNWSPMTNGLPSGPSGVVQVFAGNGTYVFAGTQKGVYRSSDNGTSWSAANTGVPFGGFSTVQALIVIGGNLFAGYNASVYMSTDNGTSWSPVNTGLPSTRVIAFAGSGTTLFAGADGVYRSTNNGSIWYSVKSGLPDGYVTALAASGTSLFTSVSYTSVWRRPLSEFIIPPPPVATSATAVLATGFTANWNASSGATGYRLDVAKDNGFTQIVAGYNDLAVAGTAQPVTGLLAGTQYYYRVRAEGPGGASANSSTITVLTMPQIPTAYSATARTSTGFMANWSTAAGATGYRLDVATDSAFGSIVAGYNDLDVGNTISYAVTGLSPGATYYYRVRALNAGWTTANSNVITVSTSPNNPPPTASAATAVTTTGFTANWSAVVGATAYRLDVATDVGFGSIIAGYSDLDVGNVTTYPVTGRSPGTTYYYRVRAVSGGGTSGNSNVITVSTVPNAPPATSATSVTTSGFTANWSAATGATGYRLDVATDVAFSSIVAGYNNLDVGDSITCAVTGQTPGTTYYYRVRALNAGGTSANSNVITVSTLPSTPNTPTATTATTITTSGFTANWNAVAGATGYHLDVATDAAFSSIVAGYNDLDAGTAITYAVTGLNPGTTYYFRVRALNAGGTSANSNVITVSTLPATPNTPTATTATSITTSGFTANWNVVVGATGYRLDVAMDVGFGSIVTGYNDLDVGNATAYPVTGQIPGTTYYYRVRAVNGGGTSASSNVITVSTLPTAPNAPTATTATSITTSGFTVSWNAAVGATRYHLDVATDAAFGSIVTGYSDLDVGNTTTYPVTGRNPGTTYYYRVRAVNGGGTSANSNVITVSTLPAAPNATTATAITTNGFAANWNAVVGATGYRLDVATDAGFLNFASPYNNYDVGNFTGCDVTGLQEGTTYYFRVRAVNVGGTSGNSNSITVTTIVSYPATYSLSWNVSFASKASLKDFGSPDYQLVGLPGNSGSLISQFLNGQQDVQWEVYWDNGTATNYPGYYVKFNGSADFQCSTGKAFWVLQIVDWAKSNESVNTASLDANREAAIPLNLGKGYYLITNPFARSIPWSMVASHNGLTGSPIRAWTSTGWVNAVDFTPYRGYLFFNDSGKTSLRIPFDQTVPKAAATTVADAGDWRIDVLVRCGKFLDQTTSFGVSRMASKGLDPLEERKPRHFAVIPDVYFDRPSWDATFPEFASDIRPGVSELESWEMRMRSDERKPVEIEFLGVESVPPELTVYLVDRAGGRGVDLRKQGTYALKPATRVTELSLVVGKEEAVKARVEEAVPKEYALLQNYPNPFNPTTMIPVSVPTESRVVLEIYTILGQRVRTLYEGTLAPGRYTFEWDGKSDQMQMNSTGVYICSLRTGKEISLSRKITLLR
jgi:photosystem II stability/assembly factor-like uncharacterized protein/phosphodiesterase/alkaline phosphatase D-like protein